MKISKIIGLCKSSRTLNLHNDELNQIQWISNGSAIFPLMDMPRFDCQSLCNTYDISDSQQSKMTIKENVKMPNSFDYSDSASRENEIKKLPFSIRYGAYDTVLFETSYGVMFVESDLLSPLSDYSDVNLKYYERYTLADLPYLAVKNGFVLIALVLPLDNMTDSKFYEDFKVLNNLIEASRYNPRAKEKKNGLE